MNKRFNGNILHEGILKSSLDDLDVRPAFTPMFWNTLALGLHLPTAKEWDAGKPREIGSHISQIIEKDEAYLRIYASGDGNLTRRQEAQGRFSGRTRARQLMVSDPIESATVKEVADIPVGNGRTLPLLRLMEHGNGEELFIMSVPDLAYYLQHDRVEIAVT